MPEEKAGQATLLDALTTKGTAFTRPERHNIILLGRLPTAEKISARQAEH
jgi:malate dehydrogenase (oxaloacetate-decarboxylating)